VGLINLTPKGINSRRFVATESVTEDIYGELRVWLQDGSGMGMPIDI